MTKHIVAMLLLGITVLTPVASVSAGDRFASIRGCVYNARSGKPIQGAWVYVQSLGSANAIGQGTGFDGCTSGDSRVDVDLFRGDYVEAVYAYRGREYRQQYQIPNGLIEKTYSYDFFLDIPLSADRPAKEPKERP